MERVKRFKIIVCFILIVVMFTSQTAHAEYGSTTEVSSGNSTTVANGGGGSGGTNKMSYLNDDGYKITTFILATTSLDYMNDLPDDVKKFLVYSRSGLKQVKGVTNRSVSKTISLYTSKVSYFGKGSQMYISDYYQQLGNSMSFQLNGIREPGYVLDVSSPSKHISRVGDNSLNDVISKCRNKIKLVPVEKAMESGGWVKLGNFSTPSDWITNKRMGKIDEVSKISENVTDEQFMEYAIRSSIASGIRYTGISVKKLNEEGITVKRSSNDKSVSQSERVYVTKVHCNKNYLFTMNDDEKAGLSYTDIVSFVGYYLNDAGNKVNVEFRGSQKQVIDAFLSRYYIDDTAYEWEDLCIKDGKKAEDNYGLNVSVVVILEPLKNEYMKGSVGSAKLKKYYGSYGEDAKRRGDMHNGVFLSMRERAYWLDISHRDKSFKDTLNDLVSGKRKMVDEKYQCGLSLNFIGAEGLSTTQTLAARLNSMMYQGSTYGEFPKVRKNNSSGRLCGNSKTFMYNGSYDRIYTSTSNRAKFNVYNNGATSNCVGGIACIGYYKERDLEETPSVNPFPVLAVRHIDSTSLNNAVEGSKDNVLMRDTITWTIPAAMGLAIQNDMARMSYLIENKGIQKAYGISSKKDTSISYVDIESYVCAVKEALPSTTSRFGPSGDVGGESTNTSVTERLAVMKDAMKDKTYKRNGISVKCMTFKQIRQDIQKKAAEDGINTSEFIGILRKSDSGETEAKSKLFKWANNALIEHYSQYDVKIPLLRGENSSVETSSSGDYWAISAKPISSDGGVYSYEDGAVTSTSQTTQRKGYKKAIEFLKDTKQSDWDSITDRDDEIGRSDETVIGETTNFINSIKYPGTRALTPLDIYNDAASDFIENYPKSSKKAKINFGYGLNFTFDRKVGSCSRSKMGSIISSYNKYRNGTDSNGKVAYYPSCKVNKSYIDIMYELTSFSNSLGFMEKYYADRTVYGQHVTEYTLGMIPNAEQLSKFHTSRRSWAYEIFPEHSLGMFMIQNSKSQSKIGSKNVYSSINNKSQATDVKLSGVKKTNGNLMTFWNSKNHTAKNGDTNVRSNMFACTSESKQRAYQTVWVPDLDSKSIDINEVKINDGDKVSSSQTATSKMFEVKEKIYGITLAYNPSMDASEAWTYRIGSGYNTELNTIGNGDKNQIPNKCVKEIEESGSTNIVNKFVTRCDKLDVSETLSVMPGGIVRLDKINTGNIADRMFIPYSSKAGWVLLKNDVIPDKGENKYTEVVNSNMTYTYNVGDQDSQKPYCVTMNVGSWISYGDMGTLDVYYDTIPTSKIYDLSLDLDTDEQGMEEFGLDSLLITSDYGIKRSKITSGYNITKPSTSYDMEGKASSRGYEDYEEYEYIGTVSIKGSDIKKLTNAISSGDKCVSSLRSGSLIYQIEKKIVDLKAALLVLHDDEVIYYINVWAKGKDDVKEINGDSYVRADELVAATKIDVPDNSIKLKATVSKELECLYHKSWSLDSINWKEFSAKPNVNDAYKVLYSKLGVRNPFTILGCVNGDNKYLFGEDWLPGSLNRWKSGWSGTGPILEIPNKLSVGLLMHRSTYDSKTKKYSKTPPLAKYMNSTEYNKKYLKLCEEYNVPVSSYDGYEGGLLDEYGWYGANKVRSIKFDVFGDIDTGHSGNLDYITEYQANFYCDNNDNYTNHSETIKNDKVEMKETANDEAEINHKLAVEGTNVGTLLAESKKEPEVYADKKIGMSDTEVVFKVPTSVSFRPCYIMRSDYDIENYEVDNKRGTAKKEEGNREPVWVLGGKERTMQVYNLHSLKITGMDSNKVQAPWSTDKRDKKNTQDTGRPTVKAGSAWKMHKTNVNLQVQSTLYLLDESFYSGEYLKEVKSFNQNAVKEHEDLVNSVKNAIGSKIGGQPFVYSSLPGGYDAKLALKHPEFKNKFTNVINGSKQEYTDSEFAKVFSKTQTKTLVKNMDITTSITSSYLNKNYEDKEYTESDFKGDRRMSINVNGKTLDVKPSVLNVDKSILTVNGVGEVNKEKNNALKAYYRQLQKATKPGMSWYKEDFEGVLQVTVTTNIQFELDSDYSIIWDNLSDWTDTKGVKVYNEAKPKDEKFDGSTDVNLTTRSSSPNTTAKIPAGMTGAGYGFMFENVNIGNINYGDISLMTSPYLFEVRGNVYDNVQG